MTAGEQQHEIGREGVYAAKAWLDATLRVRITATVYDAPSRVQMPPVAGPVRAFDLVGDLYDEHGELGSPLLVESKYVTSDGSQLQKYNRFLANCYSVTCRALDDSMDHGTEFMWLTWHPFGTLADWGTRCEPETVARAVRDHQQEVLGSRPIDTEIIKLIAGRLFLVVVPQRHRQLIMGDEVLVAIRQIEAARALERARLRGQR